ncbi:MAG: type IV toxin-antitoxin system AbiEi family antitoxin domain-containing protein [Firmicutes bacterium]|nr:type IV toxin-antitoxin system AbiEi family antitoxin domain-containing protein [Bacillota bacterium]
MTNEEKLMALLKQNNDVIKAGTVKSHGIPSALLSQLVRQKKLFKQARGIYANGSGAYDEFFAFQSRHPKCVYSYSTALYLLQLSETIPEIYEITVPQGFHVPKDTSDLKMIFHYEDKKTYSLGIISIRSPQGQIIRLYDPEKCVCDLVKKRNAFDSEAFGKALRGYAKRKDKNLKHLYAYAKVMGIEKAVQQIMEIIQE